MIMNPRLRKFVLTAHIASSVGWLGAVAAFLALAVAGLLSENVQTVRAAYISMELVGWFVIVLSSLATLLIGIVQSLGTKWGLFRHYWVLVKFLLTVGATALLIVHMQPTSRLANAAAEMSLSGLDLRPLRVQLVADAGAALLVLLAATILSVYKPWGLTAYGLRKQSERAKESQPNLQTTGNSWGLYVVIGLIGLVILFAIVHLTGGGLGQH